ncbi:molybdopterin-synthase adenylyltransferase MoeB [Pseudohoeflea coraliihabitans]|uniref:Molybdopterin-synthase adenylyltransferase MoeB n=1 Tax=Pseudohoeflea coraliihabitans TaxID=2860393 RepID=A0ABS6WNW0_9HYPH|nr:molybdopterin-synthase adenylyltransferase MoeB [Pseudohoeflea sp. DP4N28-3]MBW3097633.1 molybdopterin-synthase adenylyltransferase MoeB [Pseudohoeflea sp. DP4N28-3]
MDQNERELNAQEVQRYARHIVLKEIGGPGQAKLKAARVLVVGAGGLGSPVLSYLAAAGVGQLGIADDDTVSLSNLQRQIVHDSAHLGWKKTRSAAVALQRINPHVTTIEHDLRIDRANAADLFSGYDLVVDGTDSFDTRVHLAEAAERCAIPMVMAAVGRFDGTLTVLAPHQRDAEGRSNPRLTDLFPQAPPPGAVPACAEAGIVGALTGVMGTLQAMEVIKLITGSGTPLIGRLLLYNGLDASFETISYRRQAE